jgi:hypothetical protein
MSYLLIVRSLSPVGARDMLMRVAACEILLVNKSLTRDS